MWRLKEYRQQKGLDFIYEEEGTEEVSNQMTEVYNMGVVDQEKSGVDKRKNKKDK